MNSRDGSVPAASEADVEATIQAKGLTAPRVTPTDIDANIVFSEFLRPQSAPTLTICVLTLRNGFTVTGESACASPENFNEQLGQDIAYRNARDKCWSLMGYALKDRLSQQETPQ